MTIDALLDRIRTKRATAGVIGLGYVGLPLAVEFARAGVATIGFDIDAERTEAIAGGKSYIADVKSEDLRSVVEGLALSATTDFTELARVDTINICVPTPLRKTRDPDLSHVVTAVDQVAAHLRKGQLVVLESTTYPGTVDEVVRPRLEARGLHAGKDFCLAFSPERIDPGNREWTTRNIPRVVGGVDARSTEAAAALYGHIVETVVPVSSPRVAEMVKLLENTFRAVNIGLVNELALMCRDLDIDVWEVINAAGTKPFGFMPFYPGPGLGGHCIPVDPFYLSWKARQHGFEPRFIELAGQVNGAMPRYVVERIAEALNTRSQALRGARDPHVSEWRTRRTWATRASHLPSTSPTCCNDGAPSCRTATRSSRPSARGQSRWRRPRRPRCSMPASTARSSRPLTMGSTTLTWRAVRR